MTTCSKCKSLADAVGMGHAECLRKLLNEGADPNLLEVSGTTPLIHAVWRGVADCVKIILDAGANPDFQDSRGTTALMFAAARGYMHLLYKAGMDLTSKTDTHENCLKMLLNAGANPNLQDLNGVTALMFAADLERPMCVKLLLHAGADDTIQNNNGNTALSIACEEGAHILQEWNNISHS